MDWNRVQGSWKQLAIPITEWQKREAREYRASGTSSCTRQELVGVEGCLHASRQAQPSRASFAMPALIASNGGRDSNDEQLHSPGPQG